MNIARDLKLPLVEHPAVFHVGRPEYALSVRRIASQEGMGLSVSRHPEAWRSIAQLGDAPTHRLSRRDGYPGRFALWTSFTAEQNEALVALALRSGYLQERPGYHVWYQDPDDPDRLRQYYKHFSRSAAEKEARDLEECGMEWLRTDEATEYEATDALQGLWREHFDSPLTAENAREIACARILEEESLLDGIWWEQPLRPAELRAPRGVIFPSRLAGWTW